MIDDRINHKDDRMIEHTIKWDTSPLGPWCWHSFQAKGWEVTVEPYLYGEQSEGPFGSYTIKMFIGEKVARAVGQDLDPPNAMFVLLATLQSFAGWPVLVRWVPNVEIIEYEGKRVAVMLHMGGQGYVMAIETYEQLKPRLEARYGTLRETVRPPTEEEKEMRDRVKAVLEEESY